MSAYKLRQEVLNDPLGRGYSGMTDAQVHADLSDDTLRPVSDRESITNSELYEAVVRAEFDALAAAEKEEIRDLYKISDILVGPGSKGRNALTTIFGAGTTTRDNLLGLVTGRTQSRYDELGIAERYRNETTVGSSRIVQ